MPERTPVLTTARLRLEPFSARHLTDRYVAWLNDPDVVRFSEQRHHRHDKESCRAYVHGMAAAGNMLWAITATDPELGHVGNVAAYIDRPNRVADVTILLGARDAWNRGLGTEAWSAVCAFLGGDGGMRKITGGTMAANHAMVRVMERAGMVADGRRARQYLLDGREVDGVHYALFAE